MRKLSAIPLVVVALLLPGCTVHPAGERDERAAASDAGKSFTIPVTQRSLPALAAEPTTEDLVRYALLASTELEQHYWEWRAAIEQIPQDGTQATNLGLGISGGASLDRTTATVGNDPMADIVWPSKLSAAAHRALQNARAAGVRFQKAKLELRQKVVDACDEYALTTELIRLETANAALLKATLETVQAHSATGAAGQQEVLKARNEVDLSLNDVAKMEAQQQGQRATILALLSLPPGSAISIPQALPRARELGMSDEEIVTGAAAHNPELRALALEAHGQEWNIKLAKLQYLPDFSLGAGTDLAGAAQSLSGMITLPILRREAIQGAIAQANARFNATDAMSRQAKADLAARLVLDIALVRDADRQLKLIEQTVVPRAEQMVTLNRTGYESGQNSLVGLLESRRSLLALEQLRATLSVARDKNLVDIETISAK